MTLQPLPSEFPYIWGIFNFLFYQCRAVQNSAGSAELCRTMQFTTLGWSQFKIRKILFSSGLILILKTNISFVWFIRIKESWPVFCHCNCRGVGPRCPPPSWSPPWSWGRRASSCAWTCPSPAPCRSSSYARTSAAYPTGSTGCHSSGPVED